MNESERYFQYLCGLVDPFGGSPDPASLYILRKLWKRDFWSMTPNDDNRSSDGLVLREVYHRETGMAAGDIGTCRMLEMMIGLARRMQQEMKDAIDDEENTEGRWFWEMVRNLGLYSVADEFAEPNDEMGGRMDRIIDAVVERTYDRLGHGGLFPLKRSIVDQRRVEIWLQMQAYLMQNY